MPRNMAFPPAFPVPSAQQVLDYLNGKNMDKWVAAEGAYDLLGTALYSSPVRASVSAGIPKQAEIVATLEQLISQGSAPQDTQAPQPQADQTAPQSDQPAMVQNVTLPPWFLSFLIQLLGRLVTT